jgi:hypothetical protein
MRVNVYAEELTDRVEIIEKKNADGVFTGVRFYLELPVTMGDPPSRQVRGPFMHRPGDDDSSAVTFWSRRDLRGLLARAIELIDAHHAAKQAP